MSGSFYKEFALELIKISSVVNVWSVFDKQFAELIKISSLGNVRLALKQVGKAQQNILCDSVRSV
jgi:hypothetical protein